MTIYQIISISILFLTCSLGTYVLISNKNEPANRSFSFLILSSAFWTFCNLMADISSAADQNLFWSKTTIIGASLVAYFFYKFSLLFPRKNNYKFPYQYIVLICGLIFIAFFMTDWNISSVYLENGTFQIVTGILYIPFLFYFCLSILFGIFNLIQGYGDFSPIEKNQVKLVLLGMAITAILSAVTNIILPLLGNATLVSFGPYFTMFFIIFTVYAILKHHLFDIKVIATELLTFAIWIILLLKIFSSSGVQEVIVNSAIFIAMVIFGVFLIRSVIKEVRQREEMAKMAEDVRRAYVVEKQAKEQLQELDRFKDHFLTQAQHDLRTPLTAIMGYTDMLLQGMFGKQTKKTLEVIQKIQLVSKSMKAKADSFLDLAQFQLGKSPVTLKDGVGMFAILDEVKSELDFKASTKNIYLQLEKPEKDLVIRADREKLKAAIFNIVDNAVKYTPKGGVTIALKNHDTVKIIITDTGIGIAKEKLDSVFGTMFERSEQAKKTAAGAGVGLYLSGQIIEAHHGKVWAESEGEGKGSVFHIELPLSSEAISKPSA